MPGGLTQRELWQERIKPFRREWLSEEIKRGKHEESITLLTRMITASPDQADLVTARGEVYRLRAKDGDLDAAMADYQAATMFGGAPPETHRGLAMIFRQRNQNGEARASFERYIEAAPDAPDIPMIKSYLEELSK